MSEPDFEHVVAEGQALQRRFPELGLIAVGGTAAALHCRHRVSLDVDMVTPTLQDDYERVASLLERWEGWTSHRLTPPVLILGERHGVELGLRQQRRVVPLRTTELDGLVVPTPGEMLCIKAFLLCERRVTRDYVDVVALAQHLGESASLAALSFLNLLYPTHAPQSTITQFAESSESEPIDLASIPLTTYKGLKAPFTDWAFLADVCRRLGRVLLKRELEDSLPRSLADDFPPERH